MTQQPAGGSAPLVVLIVGAVVGQHHGQAHEANERRKHAWPDVVDVHHVGTMKKDVQDTQQGVPHGLKALDAGRGQVNVFDIGKGLSRLLSEIGTTAIEPDVHIVHVGIEVIAVSLDTALNARKTARADDRYRFHKF